MASSVNRPTDPKLRDADINNKLRLFGVGNAFANGKVPSNKQIDVAINTALESKALTNPSNKLSEEGRGLVVDLKNVIEEAKILLLSKNHDQVIQEFIWHTQRATETTSAATPNAPASNEKVKEDGQRALAGLRTLGTLVITNGQFRKLLSDVQVLFRDMASDAAQKAGGRLQPSQEQLDNLDEPAPDNQWHEAPDLSRDNIKNQAREKYNNNKPTDREQMKGALGDAAAEANPDGSRDPNAAKDRVANDAQSGGNSGVDAVGGAIAGARTAKEQIKDGIPQEHKDKVNEHRDRTKNYFKDKVPQERRDQTIFRLKKMVTEIQGHQDYQEAIDTLLYLAETYGGHTKNVTAQTAGAVKDAHGDNHLQMAEKCFKTIIERFANSTSTDDLIDSINDVYRDADNDPQLRDWFKKVDSFIRRALKEQGYILKDSSTDEYNELYDEGRFLLRDRYRDHTDRVLDELKFLGDQFAEDPQNQKFGNAVTKLFTELGNDADGKPTFKKHLITDLTNVIVPGIFENVRYVPVPRIEYTDPMMDAIVENLVLESDNLMPNVLEVGNDSYFRWGRKNISNKNRQSFMASISGVQCDLKDVSYYVKKKSGFPHLQDTGVIDVFMGGEGFSFKIKFASADGKDQQNFFKVDKVDVSVKHMTIKVKQSKHKLLFNVFKPLLLKVLRPVIQKVLEVQIKKTFNDLDGKLYRIKTAADQEAAKAKEDLKNDPSPENAQNIYSRYASAAQREFTAKKEEANVKKEKVKEATADKHANVAMTKEDSMFKNISLPGGVSTKATEYKELARQGDRWESPVFDIGTAKPSTSLPTPSEITRKPHNTRRAALRSNRDSGFTEQPGLNANSGQAFVPSAVNEQTPNTSGYTAGQTGYGSSTTGSGYDSTTTRTGPYEALPTSTVGKPPVAPYDAGNTADYNNGPGGPGYNTGAIGSDIRSALGRS